MNRLANRTVPQIFAAFKETYQNYMHRGFRITTVHSNGELAPLQYMVASLAPEEPAETGTSQDTYQEPSVVVATTSLLMNSPF